MTTTHSTIQGVIHIDLEEFRIGKSYDSTQLDRVMRDYGDCLAIGAPIRIRVHDLAPVGTTFWRTLPLTFQIEAANPWILDAWLRHLNGGDE